MSGAFGNAVPLTDDTRYAPLPPHEDVARVRAALQGLKTGGAGLLRAYCPAPTAAFSPRDTTHGRFRDVARRMETLGFAAVERGAGGTFAAYDTAALVIDLVAAHGQPHGQMLERFSRFAGAIADALCKLGIDARVGEVPDEYCPGKYSVNAGGRLKLAGIAQRITRHGYHLGAVLAVSHSPPALTAVAEAYEMMSLPFAPSTFSNVLALRQNVRASDVTEAIISEVLRLW
ncbi:MAG: hypothetical protein U1E15_05480 [Hyphomicrobiales bacterium]